jgi:hypothetical protein
MGNPIAQAGTQAEERVLWHRSCLKAIQKVSGSMAFCSAGVNSAAEDTSNRYSTLGS